jgi:hypothetical protein
LGVAGIFFGIAERGPVGYVEPPGPWLGRLCGLMPVLGFLQVLSQRSRSLDRKRRSRLCQSHVCLGLIGAKPPRLGPPLGHFDWAQNPVLVRIFHSSYLEICPNVKLEKS